MMPLRLKLILSAEALSLFLSSLYFGLYHVDGLVFTSPILNFLIALSLLAYINKIRYSNIFIKRYCQAGISISAIYLIINLLFDRFQINISTALMTFETVILVIMLNIIRKEDVRNWFNNHQT